MGFDFENIIYLLGIIIWILSSFFGKKKKIKPLGDKKIDPYTHDEKKIPKSFSDLVQQVKSELDKKDDVDRDIIINPDMDDLSQDEYIKDSHGELDKKITEINDLQNEDDEKIKIKEPSKTNLIDNQIKNQNKPEALKENKELERLDGYKIIEEINQPYENELFDELKNKDSLKKAFLFKEILKRKFK